MILKRQGGRRGVVGRGPLRAAAPAAGHQATTDGCRWARAGSPTTASSSGCTPLFLKRRSADDRHERRLLVAHRLDRCASAGGLVSRPVMASPEVFRAAGPRPRCLLDEVFAGLGGLGGVLGRDLLGPRTLAPSVSSCTSAPSSGRMSMTPGSSIGAQRPAGRTTGRLRLLTNLRDRSLEVRADTPVILLTKQMRGHPVLVRLAPHRSPTAGSTPDSASHTATGPVRPRAADRSTSAVNSTWPGRVDDVDAVIAPEAVVAAEGDRDPPLPAPAPSSPSGGPLVTSPSL